MVKKIKHVKKKKIPKALKDLVWNKYYSKQKGNCVCCGINEISISTYEAGHIIAESKGGKTDINNLAPVCSTCNKSMGIKNMKEFMKDNFGRDFNCVVSDLNKKKIMGGIINFITSKIGLT